MSDYNLSDNKRSMEVKAENGYKEIDNHIPLIKKNSQTTKEESLTSQDLKEFEKILNSKLKSLEEKNCIPLQAGNETDQSDRAMLEYTAEIDRKNNERNEKLKIEIEEALQRIKDKVYGYCQQTGEKIGKARLLANPLALYCIEVAEKMEKENPNSFLKEND